MQNKLRQLVISALKRNEYTRKLPLAIYMRGYDVQVSGEVSSARLKHEVIQTIESVSPYLRVESRITVAPKQEHAAAR